MSPKRCITVLSIAALLTAGLLRAGAVSAVTINPAGTFEATGFMTFELFGVIADTCEVSIEGEIDDVDEDGYGEGPVKVTSLIFNGSTICDDARQLRGLPYDADFVDQNTFVIYDFDLDTNLGKCSGDLVGNWNGANSEIIYDGAPLNGPFGSTCRMYSVAGPSDDTVDGLDTIPALDVQP